VGELCYGRFPAPGDRIVLDHGNGRFPRWDGNWVDARGTENQFGLWMIHLRRLGEYTGWHDHHVIKDGTPSWRIWTPNMEDPKDVAICTAVADAEAAAENLRRARRARGGRPAANEGPRIAGADPIWNADPPATTANATNPFVVRANRPNRPMTGQFAPTTAIQDALNYERALQREAEAAAAALRTAAEQHQRERALLDAETAAAIRRLVNRDAANER